MWHWEDIDRDYLLGQPILVSKEKVVDAFNLVDELLGKKWINRNFTNKVGPLPTLSVVVMGEMLKIIKSCKGANNLIDKLKNDDRSAKSEIESIFIVSPSEIDVEIEPEVSIRNTKRMPDFRIKKNNQDWVYVEVTSPNTSERNVLIQVIMNQITCNIETLQESTSVDILLDRDPSAEEIEQIIDKIKTLSRNNKPNEYSLSDLGRVEINMSQPGQIVTKNYGEIKRSRLGMATTIVENGIPKHISVRIPFLDDRADSFITSEAKQLPKNEIGLIMIDMNQAVAGFKEWEELILRRFQPEQHTRVSGVCMFRSAYEAINNHIDWKLETYLIENKYAI